MVAIPIAYILDLVFGDPRWMPHPVKGIGWLVSRLELSLRRLIRPQRLAGIAFALIIIGITWASVFFITRQLGLIASIFFIYTSLAIKDLKVEAMAVCKALEASDLNLARRDLGMIVGRDTAALGEKDVIRAAVETVSENIVDGIISPLFYAFLGGAPLVLAYKAVNTLDSMVGYKNGRYREFGWASAKLDDIANFIPARISAIIIPVAGWLAGQNGALSFRIAIRDGRKNPSPNSGIPEAAMAGALGIKLGGLNFYNSVAAEKPLIGEDRNDLSVFQIKESIKIAYISSALFMIIMLFLIL